MTLKNTISNINENWTDIYHALHYVHQENIPHQAIRLLKHIEKQQVTTIGNLAAHLSVSHNTASEHIKRLIKKAWYHDRSNFTESIFFVIFNDGI